MQDVDAQSDLWAVGAVAFTLLSGAHVHEPKTGQDIMALTAERPRSVASVAPETPRPIVEVVDKALELDKGSRWHDAVAMKAALAGAYWAAFGAPLP